MDTRGLKELGRERLTYITLKRKWAHGRWLKLTSKVYDAAMKMEEAAFIEGALTRKQKELIALGIGVITDCESCMQWHMEQAVKAGATRREIVETLEVAIERASSPPRCMPGSLSKSWIRCSRKRTRREMPGPDARPRDRGHPYVCG